MVEWDMVMPRLGDGLEEWLRAIRVRRPFSAALKHQRGVGAAEAETVGHDGVNPAAFGHP
jgi:hypothetical protein